MKPHHEAWLTAHPERSADWLREKLREGFDIHHLDGNHDNNDPSNLVLIDGSDHMRLHGGRMLRRLGPPQNKNGRRGKNPRTAGLPDGRKIIVFRGEREREAIDRFLRNPGHNAFRLVNE